MRLTQAQAQRVQGQIGAEAIPGDHPTAMQLEGIFGGHTFFVGPRGLHVVEPVPAETERHAAAIVKIAIWQDAAQTKLLPHGAEIDGEVELGAEEEPKPDA
jgi:hypothetical protein